MKQGESANWSFNPEQFADLASSLNNFFTQVGSNSPRQNVSQQYDSLAGKYYVDNFITQVGSNSPRQNVSQ